MIWPICPSAATTGYRGESFRKELTEVDAAGIILRVEPKTAQRARERREKEIASRSHIIPHIGCSFQSSIPLASLLPFKSAENSPSAVRKHVVEARRRQVGAGRFLHNIGHSAFSECVSESASARLQLRQVCRGILRGFPCILEAGGVIVADDRVAFSGGADHPHESGVRLGKCHASRNV